MKKLLLICTALTVLATPAAAQDLKNSDCLALLAGLNGLDGFSVTVNEGKPNEQTYVRAYKFASASLRLTIQRNISVLRGVQEDVEAARQKIFREISKDGADIPQGTAAFVDYSKQVQALGEQKCPATLVRIKADELKLGENEIPGTVLAAISKILDY